MKDKYKAVPTVTLARILGIGEELMLLLQTYLEAEGLFPRKKGREVYLFDGMCSLDEDMPWAYRRADLDYCKMKALSSADDLLRYYEQKEAHATAQKKSFEASCCRENIRRIRKDVARMEELLVVLKAA